MVKVAITARHEFLNKEHFNKLSAVPLSIVETAHRHNCCLVTVYSKKEVDFVVENCDALIVTGSSINIDPFYYTPNVDKDLGAIDEFEMDRLLIREFRKLDLPVIGICGGLQAINVALGGTLYQVTGHYDCIHNINIDTESFIGKSGMFPSAKGYIPNVNSYHNFAVKDIPSGLSVVASSFNDGIVEALESTDGRIFGVQWHPEELNNDSFDRLFQYFTELIKR